MSDRDTFALDKLNLSLGSKIRTLRTQRGFTIADLAGMTSLSSSLISQLERALTLPSIPTLKKICDALDVPISYLFENAQVAANSNQITDSIVEPTTPSVPKIDFDAYDIFQKLFPPTNLKGPSRVVHEKNRKFLSPGQGIRFYLLNPDLSGPIEFIYNEYDPGASTGRYSHRGSECGLILSGELIVEINDEIYVLKEGDSITFDSSDPHLKRNDSDQMCTCVWANVPPWF